MILSLLQQKIDCNKRNCQRQQVSQIYHYQSPRLNLLAMIGTLIRVIPVDPEGRQTFDGPKFHQRISLEVLERLRLPSLLRIRVKFGWSWMLISRSRYSYSILYSLYIISYTVGLEPAWLELFWYCFEMLTNETNNVHFNFWMSLSFEKFNCYFYSKWFEQVNKCGNVIKWNLVTTFVRR